MSTEQMQSLKNLAGRKILVVDDVIDNQVLECVFLRRLGLVAEVASNGIEAVQKALEGSFDAVLMDLHMPYLDGISATVNLRGRGFQKPIIAVTADGQESVKKRVLSVGFNDYIPKPLLFTDLYRSLKKHLEH